MSNSKFSERVRSEAQVNQTCAKPKISVVVPTCRRPELLQRCLSALFTQKLAPEAYEIIIVDDAGCAETHQLVEDWMKQAEISGHTLLYLSPEPAERHGPAAARNKGWRKAQGAIIAFTDDDCVPMPDWLVVGMSAFLEAEVMAASGQVIVPLPEKPTDYECNAAGLANSEFVTANCFYRYSALQQTGGFDERFTQAWREDSDLYFSVLAHGMTCIMLPEAKVIHPLRPALWGISAKQQQQSMFNALLYKKHPLLYQQHIQVSPPWHYYKIVLSLLIGMLGVIRRSKLLMLGGFGLWFWLTGRFCARRLCNTSHAPAHVLEMGLTSVLIPPLSIFWRLVGMIKFRVPFL